MAFRTAIAALAAASLLAAGCGDDEGSVTAGQTAAPDASEAPTATAATPPGSEGPAAGDAPSPVGDPGAGEASPEAAAEGPEGSPLSDFDRQAVVGAYENYVRQIDVRDARAVCATFAPGGLPTSELPVDRGSCARSVAASLGTKPSGGAPAWERTKIVDANAESVGEGEARVTATVVHTFADRKYTSVEEDVVYFRELGERWAVEQPSATLYRAVGYPEPPLRAYTPPG